MKQLDSENADRDITSIATVLTHTPDASNPKICQGHIAFGDGTKNLDGTGGDFELTITVGGQTIEPDPQRITFSTAVRAGVWTTLFPVPANAEVIMRVKSPNGADTDVDVTAYLYDINPQVDANARVNVGRWLDQAVTVSTGNKPDVNVTEWANVLLEITNNLDAAVSSRSTAGSGADEVTLTITDGDDTPLSNVGVWITTDAAGSNVVAGTLYTDSNGQATFMLDAANTYYRWAEKDGWNFTNPTSFVAVAD